MPAKQPDSSIYQLKVTLKYCKPPIWRRIQVRGNTTLYTLHQIIQITMGWTDSHLHQFIAGGVYYGESHPDLGLDVANEREVRLNQIVTKVKDRFVYEYDFGDGWEHEVVVEALMEPAPGVSYPRCITGKRHCPPEDVGGAWGYAHFLEAIQNEDHPEHEHYMEWSGGPFDPEEFDCQGINEGLK